MDYRDPGIQTQLRNIEAQTGATLAQLEAEVSSWGPLKHGEIRTRLQEQRGLSFVHADTLILSLQRIRREREGGAAGDPLDEIYVGAKAALRSIHEALMARIAPWGPFEVAPKKGYISLRRRKQFCMIGPATKTRVALGINAKGLTGGPRLKVLPPGKLCPLEVHLTDPNQVDEELMGWVRAAWDQSA